MDKASLPNARFPLKRNRLRCVSMETGPNGQQSTPDLTKLPMKVIDRAVVERFQSERSEFSNRKSVESLIQFGAEFSSVLAVFFQYHQRHKVLADDLTGLGIQRRRQHLLHFFLSERLAYNQQIVTTEIRHHRSF